MRVYTAAHVLPVTAPPLACGAVAVAGGRIVAVGPAARLTREAPPGAEVVDLGRAALLPGPVNAHCHLELSWMAADPPRGPGFVDWVRGMIERRDRFDADAAREAAERGLAQAAARGTAAVGDVANGTWVQPLVARSGLHGVLFHEVLGPLPAEADARLSAAVRAFDALRRDPDVAAARGRLDLALAPHAPHTTAEPLLRGIAAHGAPRRAPLSIHVAESAEECAFVAGDGGPFADLLAERGLRAARHAAPGLSPVAWLERLGLLGPRLLAVHCVHLAPADGERLRAHGATVVTCPRSNERLGVGRAPVAALCALGVPVALGTDSLASAPDLDPFAELAALRRLHPELDPAIALRAATLHGAAALGLAARLGSLDPGKLARLVAVPLHGPGDDPLDAVCSGPERVFPLGEETP